MQLKQIKEFLRNRPGYLKEGGKRLSKRLEGSTIAQCKQAIREVNSELPGKGSKTFKLVLNESLQPTKIKRLFYDIETSYNIGKFWRAGYNLNINHNDIIHERAILTIAWKWEGDDTVHFETWNNGDDKELVQKFVNLMYEADELVGHNIERYDTAFIMTRALKHGILALPKYKQFDTLKKAKYHFNFNSNKLDYIATLLGLGGKYKHSGMSMWDDIILYDLFKMGTKEKRNAAMGEMIYYNCIDVALTEEVFNRLRLYSTHETHHGVLLGKPKFTCPNDGSENVELIKTVVTAAGTIKRLMRCNDCGQQYFISNKDYLNFLKT
ncbi:MAG TPA: ribonuclease H-like domain-containing protein [Candidatus Paceibacterota bacterium]|nr:ribonuclease H-like domain-containing protein [Candidatus Paceibacterota bacterium]